MKIAGNYKQAWYRTRILF